MWSVFSIKLHLMLYFNFIFNLRHLWVLIFLPFCIIINFNAHVCNFCYNCIITFNFSTFYIKLRRHRGKFLNINALVFFLNIYCERYLCLFMKNYYKKIKGLKFCKKKKRNEISWNLWNNIIFTYRGVPCCRNTSFLKTFRWVYFIPNEDN